MLAAKLLLVGATLLDLGKVDVVDLTHAFNEKTPYWPTSPSGFELKTLQKGPSPGGWFYSANAFCAPEHGGTHLDAPIHFGEGKLPSSAVPLSRLMAPAVVIDVSAKAAADRDYRLTPEDVAAWEKVHGAIAAGSIVLLRTGWSKRYSSRKDYFGDDTPGDASKLHFPGYGEAAVKQLIEARQVAAIGLDTASIDYGASKDFPVHRLLASANLPAFENLASLEALPETGAFVIALPMKIEGGTGGPLRAIALVPKR
jgi:kynurenine formamidase